MKLFVTTLLLLLPATAFAQLEVLNITGPTFHPLPHKSWRLVLAKTVAIEQESTDEHDEQISRQVVLQDYFGGDEYEKATFTGKSYSRRERNSGGKVVNPPLKVGEVNLWQYSPTNGWATVLVRQDREQELWKDWNELAQLCLAVANTDEKDWVSLIKPKVTSANEIMAMGAVNMLYRWASPEAQQALRDLAEEGTASIKVMRIIDNFLLDLGRRTYRTEPSSEWLESETRLRMAGKLGARIETKADHQHVALILRKPELYNGPHAEQYLAMLVHLATSARYSVDSRAVAAGSLGTAAWTSESPNVRQAMLDLLVSNQPIKVRYGLVQEIRSRAKVLQLNDHRGLIESLRAEEKSPELKKLLGQLLLSIDEAAEMDD